MLLPVVQFCFHVSNDKKRGHKTWIRKYTGKGIQLGAFNTLLTELSTEDVKLYMYDYLQIDLTTFEELYSLIEPEVV